jgi:hypothetical protein
MELDYMPCCNSFDEFVSYDGNEIQDYNLYYVKKIDDSISYPMKRYDLCYGMNIKDLTNIEIIAELVMTKLKTNISKQIIKSVYDNPDLRIDMKKGLFNHLTGMYDKSCNKKQKVVCSKDEKEANAFTKRYGGNQFQKDDIHFNVCKKKSDLHNGFKPIGILIKDCAQRKLFDLKKELENCDFIVYGANTDCLYTDFNNDKLEKFQKKYSKYFDYEDKSSFLAIGKLKIENVRKSFQNVMTVKEVENAFIECDNNNIIVNKIASEINWKTDPETYMNECREIIGNKNMLVLGNVPGAGKSHVCMNVYKDKNIFYPSFQLKSLKGFSSIPK